MNLYSIDVRIYGTLYIKAISETAAREAARKLAYEQPILELQPQYVCDGLEISGCAFDDPRLPTGSATTALAYRPRTCRKQKEGSDGERAGILGTPARRPRIAVNCHQQESRGRASLHEG